MRKLILRFGDLYYSNVILSHKPVLISKIVCVITFNTTAAMLRLAVTITQGTARCRCHGQ